MSGRGLAARDQQRARIVLLAAAGESNRLIAETVGLHYNQVAVWRRRYDEFGDAGLDDGARSGRPVIYGHDDVLKMVHLVTTDPPEGYACWSCEMVAARMSDEGMPVSASQVWRIFDGLDLKPWQTQSWLTSHDPAFWERPLMCAACIWTCLPTRWCDGCSRYGEFDSVDGLADRVIAFINDYNRRAQPFRWTYDGRPLRAARSQCLARARTVCSSPGWRRMAGRLVTRRSGGQ